MSYTYSKIASYTVGSSGVQGITFNAIPQNYTDIKVMYSARGVDNFNDCILSLNGSTSNRTMKYMYGTGIGPAAADDTTFYMLQVRSTYTANTFSNCEFTICNYASSNYKPIILDQTTENNTNTSTIYLGAQLWSSIEPVTSLTLAPISSTNFAQYSTFHLYGIKAEV